MYNVVGFIQEETRICGDLEKKLMASRGKEWEEGVVREFGGEWIHVYIWLSPFAIHLKLSHHC